MIENRIDPEHLHLFRSEWVANPAILTARVKKARLSSPLTVELAAWCGEIHIHLAELADELAIPLVLMGGSAAALRLDIASQRGSRDNDYLTSASRSDVETLLDALSRRFEPLHPLFAPRVHEPKKKEKELDLLTYLVPIPLLLDHGNAPDPHLKVEFHFAAELPPAEDVTALFGGIESTFSARLPRLPYQIALKLLTIPRPPVGVPDVREEDAIPRQLYDLDHLSAPLSEEDWGALVEYFPERYVEEAKGDAEALAEGEPWTSIQARLEAWADCLHPDSRTWRAINAVQTSQIPQPARIDAWGWRARASRLLALAHALQLGADGFSIWKSAYDTAEIVPIEKAKRFRDPLSHLSGVDQAGLPAPFHLRAFLWSWLGQSDALERDVARAREALLDGGT